MAPDKKKILFFVSRLFMSVIDFAVDPGLLCSP